MAISFTSTGQVKEPTAEELAKADEDTAILGYVHGTMGDGRPYYAYVAIRPSRYREFHALTASQRALVIGDYGTVLAAGFEPQAPPEVEREMREVYGFDDQYEAKLKQQAIKQQETFFASQEKKRIDDIVAMLKTKAQPNQ